MKLTGHNTPSVLQRYNIVSDGDLATAARMLDSIGSWLAFKRYRIKPFKAVIAELNPHLMTLASTSASKQ